MSRLTGPVHHDPAGWGCTSFTDEDPTAVSGGRDKGRVGEPEGRDVPPGTRVHVHVRPLGLQACPGVLNRIDLRGVGRRLDDVLRIPGDVIKERQPREVDPGSYLFEPDSDAVDVSEGPEILSHLVVPVLHEQLRFRPVCALREIGLPGRPDVAYGRGPRGEDVVSEGIDGDVLGPIAEGRRFGSGIRVDSELESGITVLQLEIEDDDIRREEPLLLQLSFHIQVHDGNVGSARVGDQESITRTIQGHSPRLGPDTDGRSEGLRIQTEDLDPVSSPCS